MRAQRSNLMGLPRRYRSSNDYLLRSFTIMYMESKVADIGLHHVKKPVLESGKGNFSVWTIYPVR